MKVFTNKDVKIYFIIMVSVLLCCILLGQAVVNLISDDYKNQMIEHDYKTAGYLYLHNPELEKELPKAFTTEKSDNDFDTGKTMLEDVGYQSSVNINLLPDINKFHKKYSSIVLILSIIFSLAVLAVVFFFIFTQDRKLERATTHISMFMDGNYELRLNDSEEGTLSKLFSSINTMSTSLTTHIAKEKQNKEFLRDMISDISHQLKTPLAALQMYNEIIQSENLANDVVNNFMIKSENELVRMQNLIQNLLKLAKLDAGTIELEKSDHDLKDLVEQSIKVFRTRAELENKSIILNCDSGIIMNCDEEWFIEAISNIVKNSLDHTVSAGKVSIECTETPILTRISIKDNGTGIHPEDIHHIFKRFYRSRFSKDRQGVGIGLSLTKSIVEKHGGSIMVESEPGKGTTFQLIFPKLTNL